MAASAFGFVTANALNARVADNEHATRIVLSDPFMDASRVCATARILVKSSLEDVAVPRRRGPIGCGANGSETVGIAAIGGRAKLAGVEPHSYTSALRRRGSASVNSAVRCVTPRHSRAGMALGSGDGSTTGAPKEWRGRRGPRGQTRRQVHAISTRNGWRARITRRSSTRTLPSSATAGSGQ